MEQEKQENGYEMENHSSMSQEEAEATVAWIAEDEQIDAEIEMLMKEDPEGKKKGKKEKKQKVKKSSGTAAGENAGNASETNGGNASETNGGKGKIRKRLKKYINWKSWSRKRKIITVACVAVAGVVVFKSLTGGGNDTMPVSTVPVTRGTIQEDLTVSGPVSGTDSVDVVSNLHAEVTELRVKEGDRVEAGQLLAVIDSSDLIKEVDMAQNEYDLAVTTYEEQQIQAENGYAKAVQDYEAARAEYERTNVLYEAGSVSKVEWETARNRMNDAERETRNFTLVDGKPVANESYSLQIKNKEFELEKKKEELEDCQVTSPITGTVVRVNAKVGRFADKIEDDKPMFIIENLDVLEMKISISEYSIGKIEVGQEAEISADILNGTTVKGSVTAISPTGEEKGGGSTERVIPTTIRIEDTNTKLIAGITARAKITLNEADNAWIVPISAVLETEEGSFIIAVEQNVLRRIPVETGVESDIQVEIIPQTEGALTEEMQVVASPVESMTDGMKVFVMPSA